MKSDHDHHKREIADDIALLQEGGGKDKEVEAAITRIVGKMDEYSKSMKGTSDVPAKTEMLKAMNDLIRESWAVAARTVAIVGYDFGDKVCEILLKNGILEILLRNFEIKDSDLKFESARLLEQALTAENIQYVLKRDLPITVKVGCEYAQAAEVEKSRIGSGILSHIFETTEDNCAKLIEGGALFALINCCRTSDLETLRYCADGLANLALYGGSQNQLAMAENEAPEWLFTLANNEDDFVKYYACLAISLLVANKEVGRAAFKSDTLYLVQRFVATHTPKEFAFDLGKHFHGQSKHWLEKLIPCLESDKEEARSFAAFHFATEAHIKKAQEDTEVFHEIGAVEIMKKVAGSPDAVASKLCREALALIDEEVPQKLSAQVPIWTVEDVVAWLSQIDFSNYSDDFLQSKVDGDLLLRMTNGNLEFDIGMHNGLLRKRFLRELNTLKINADYTCSDLSGLSDMLHQIGPELCRYTYHLLLKDVTVDNIKLLSDEQLQELGVSNSLHRMSIIESARYMSPHTEEGGRVLEQRRWDVFLSYRRSGGAHLASLLRVYLQLRGYTVFLDVKNLSDGKFDRALVQIIHDSEHFILILNNKALERCMGDYEMKDWLHVEIVLGMEAGCHIIPILHDYDWPDQELLPEDMRDVGLYNAVSWVHEYQDDCVDKIVKFMEDGRNKKFTGGTFKKHDHDMGIEESLAAKREADAAKKKAAEKKAAEKKAADTAQKDTETVENVKDAAQIKADGN